MALYFIYYGMNYAGMGPDTNPPVLEEHETDESAQMSAYEHACEDCNGWEGIHGIPYFTEDEEEIENNPDEYARIDERDSHIDYYAQLATPELIIKEEKNWGTKFTT